MEGVQVQRGGEGPQPRGDACRVHRPVSRRRRDETLICAVQPARRDPVASVRPPAVDAARTSSNPAGSKSGRTFSVSQKRKTAAEKWPPAAPLVWPEPEHKPPLGRQTAT